MTQIVLTQLLWDTSEDEPRWHREDALWWSDWRSLPHQGAPGPTPQGWVLAGFPTGVVPPNSVDLGDSLGSLVLPGRRAAIRDTLGLGEALPGDSLSDVFQSLLIGLGDPTSQTRWRGIRANGNRLQLRIGGAVILDEPFDETHPAWGHTRDIFRAAYRRNRALVDAGLMPLDVLRSYTGHEMRKYGVNHDALLPPEYVDDGWLPPRTTIGDTFVETTDTVLTSHTATGPNGGFGWTNIRGTDIHTVKEADDKLKNNASGEGEFRADSDLSSDEHYAQCDIEDLTNNGDEFRLGTRKDSSSTLTYYRCEWRFDLDRQRIAQYVGGTGTTLVTKTSTALDANTVYTVKIDVDSNDIIRQYIGGVEEQSYDDSASPVGSGNLRTVIGGDPASATNPSNNIFDDFEAEDLAAAAVARRRVGIGAGWAARR